MYTWNETGPDGHQIRLDDSYTPTYLVHPDFPGTYTFEVDISDSAGAYRPSNTVQVTFTAPTPHLSASASTAVVGESVTLTATGAAQLPTSLPPVTYTWNQTGPDGHQIRLDEGNSSTYLAHPTVPGTYTYEVDITDNAGDHRPSNTVQVTFTPPTSTPTS